MYIVSHKYQDTYLRQLRLLTKFTCQFTTSLPFTRLLHTGSYMIFYLFTENSQTGNELAIHMFDQIHSKLSFYSTSCQWLPCHCCPPPIKSVLSHSAPFAPLHRTSPSQWSGEFHVGQPQRTVREGTLRARNQSQELDSSTLPTTQRKILIIRL